ncbi:hypothetical protein AVEN_4788-1, partial [Araneus ventricosus]
RLLGTKVVWPFMKKDIAMWAQSCLECQRNKVSRHIRSPLGSFQLPSDSNTSTLILLEDCHLREGIHTASLASIALQDGPKLFQSKTSLQKQLPVRYTKTGFAALEPHQR